MHNEPLTLEDVLPADPPAPPVVAVEPKPPTYLWEGPDFLVTGEAWRAASVEAQVEVMAAYGAGDTILLYDDVLDVIPDQSKEWLAGWQHEINRGSCWNTSGSIGRQANALIKDGLCLLGHEPRADHYGSKVPSRSMAPDGTAGSPGLVRKRMSQRYLDWIAAIP